MSFNVYLIAAVAALVIIGGLSVAYIAARVYVRAAQLQTVWHLRVDSLSEHAWELLRDRVSPSEFESVVKSLEQHNIRRTSGSRDAAPIVIEVLREYSVN